MIELYKNSLKKIPDFLTDTPVKGAGSEINVQNLRVHQLEKELEQTEEELNKFRSVLYSFSEPIVITNAKAEIIYVNPAWEKLTGYSLFEVVGKNPSLLRSSQTSPKLYEKMWQSLNQRTPFSSEELTDRKKDGSQYNIRTTIFPVIRNDQIIYYVQIISDITALKEHEALLARYESIVKWSNDAIMTLSNDLLITCWNPAAEKLYGYRSDEILGQSIRQLIPKHRLKEYKTLYQPGHREHVNFETERMHKSGAILPVSITVSSLIDDSGRQIGFSVIHRSIEERIKTEKMKQTFLSLVAHELKTPITTLKLMYQVYQKQLEKLTVRGQSSNRDVKGSIELIDAELDTLTFLINDLLDASRLETGKFHLNLADTNLSELMIKIYQKLSLLKGNHRFVQSIDPNCRLFIDPVRFEQVLTNLVTNAFKHSGGDSEVLISLKDGKDQFLITVEDGGRGIAKKDLPHVFDQFYQGDTKTQGGFGLGLYIVKSIIKKHGGKITVVSQRGKGTTFSIHLPKQDKLYGTV